jgi:hypothetical protein
MSIARMIITKNYTTSTSNNHKPQYTNYLSQLESIKSKTYADALTNMVATSNKSNKSNSNEPSKLKGKYKTNLKPTPNPTKSLPRNNYQNNTNTQDTHFNIPSIIKSIHLHHQDPLQKSPWSFERTKEAATKNSMLLHSLHFDVEAATQNPPNTILSYGSEFHPTKILKPLLRYHPQWSHVESIINNGADYPLTPINEKDRLDDINYMIERGNHQLTQPKENKSALDKAFDKEVAAQWAIPLNPAVINMIPGASITPLGVATQWTVNPQNDRIKKRRVTHDCTFPGISGNSCNKRVIPELLEECR